MNRLSQAERARRLYERYEALLIIAQHLDARGHKRLADIREHLSALKGEPLRGALRDLRETIAQLSTHIGLTVSPRILCEVIAAARKATPKNSYLNIAKFQLAEWCTKYENVMPGFSKYPPHPRIAIDIHGLRPDTKGVEIFQLEASLFEDMASLWNLTLDMADSMSYDADSSKVRHKSGKALKRATAKAVFSLLEGYLNGLSADILTANQVSPAELSQLAEWDYERAKSRPLSLRHKLLTYPRIALGLKHPILDENNCDEVEVLVTLEKSLRHALIHPNLRAWNDECREDVYWNLSLDDVAILIDTALSLIEKIEASLQHMFGDASVWLSRRGSSGRFDAEAFI